MSAFVFILGSLATWRLASLISVERGPFAIGTKLREAFGVHHDTDGTPERDSLGEIMLNPLPVSEETEKVLHEIGLGLICLWCCSLWVSLVVAIWSRPYSGIRAWFVTALSLSTTAIGIQKLIER